MKRIALAASVVAFFALVCGASRAPASNLSRYDGASWYQKYLVVSNATVSLCSSNSGSVAQPPFGAILACELEAAGSVGTHLQQEFAEVLIVVEGEGVARVGASPMVMQPGVVLEIRLGQTLALENTSPALPLRYLIVKAK